MPVDRASAIEAIVLALRQQLRDLVASAEVARDEATNEHSKAENKYDTRAIEAAYFAGAQSLRVQALRRALTVYERLGSAPVSDGTIDGPCLVTVRDGVGQQRFYFIGPAQGGLAVSVDGAAVRVITPDSPLGGRMVGLGVGDSFTTPTCEHLDVVGIDHHQS